MNFDLSRQSPFATVLFLALLIFVFWGSQLSVTPHPIPSFTPLEKTIDNWAEQYVIITRLITAALVFLISLSITRLTIRNVIFLERTYMPALIFMVISSGYYSSVFSLRPLISALMLLSALTWILRSYNRKGLASGDFVVSGFWFAMAIIVFTPTVIVLPMLFIGILMFRFWDIREWISALAGVLLPITIGIAIFVMTGGNVENVWGNITHGMNNYNEGLFEPFRKINILQWTFIGTITVITLLSIITFFSNRKSFGAKSYITYLYFVWFALLTIVGGSLLPIRTIYILPIVAIPLSVMLPSFFNARKATFLSNFLYAMFIITAIAISIFPLIVISLK